MAVIQIGELRIPAEHIICWEPGQILLTGGKVPLTDARICLALDSYFSTITSMVRINLDEEGNSASKVQKDGPSDPPAGKALSAIPTPSR